MEDDPQDRGRRSDDAGEGDENPESPAEGGWDDEPVLDEEFIQGATVSESAARTRMLRIRWRHDPPEPSPWRADKPPAGWFFSKARRRRPRRKRNRGDE